MAIPILGTTPRDLGGGQTGSSRVAGFVRIQVNEKEAIEALLRAATRAGKDATPFLNAACKEAMQGVMGEYKRLVNNVTGNLSKSVAVRGIKNQKARGVGVAIGGPQHAKSGNEWDVEVKGAGNHAWLYEFGTGRRKAGTQGRRTPINVHQKINGRFRRQGDSTQWVRNDQFDRLGRGNYFIMSSYDEPTRQAKKGSGYPHDFFMALESGDTYGAMRPSHAMERAIEAARGPAMNTLIDAIKSQISRVAA